MSKRIYIYRIIGSYKRCEVWHGSPSHHERLSTSMIVPDDGLTRRERYDVISEWLHERFGLRCSDYEPTKREAQS